MKPDRRFVSLVDIWLGQKNRVGRMQMLADEIGVDIGSVKNWVYRETFPNGVQLLAIFDFCNGVEESTRRGISPSVAERNAVAEVRLAAARKLVKEAESIMAGDVVPIKGKVS